MGAPARVWKTVRDISFRDMVSGVVKMAQAQKTKSSATLWWYFVVIFWA